MRHKEKKGLIITIDGPSGAGKSTVARRLANRLGYLYIDTGAMYRAVALIAKEKKLKIEDEESLRQWVSSLDIVLTIQKGETHILCDGEDVTQRIRSPEISLLASEISKRRGAREALVKRQREMAKGGGVVLEGRDTGTVVFPDADVKFYLDAESRERGRRRYKELIRKGAKVRFRETLEEVIQRDHNDMHRRLSPLKKAEDAVLIDSTHQSVEGVVEEMARIVSKKIGEREST